MNLKKLLNLLLYSRKCKNEIAVMAKDSAIMSEASKKEEADAKNGIFIGSHGRSYYIHI